MKGKSKSVLIIEDEREIREILREMCVSQGHSAVLAKDGSEGLFKIKNQKFDIIVTDLNMPKASGAEVIKTVREQDKGQTTPIIVVSGNLQEYEPQLAITKNIVTLRKPFKSAEFFQAFDEASNLSSEKSVTSNTMREALVKICLSKSVELFNMVTKSEVKVKDVQTGEGPFAADGGFLFIQGVALKKNRCQLVYAFDSKLAKNVSVVLSQKKDVKELPDLETYKYLVQLVNVFKQKNSAALKSQKLSVEFGSIHSVGKSGSTTSYFVSNESTYQSMNLVTSMGQMTLYFIFPKE